MRPRSWGRRALPLLLAATLSVGLGVAGVSAGTMLSAHQTESGGVDPADRGPGVGGDDFMLANYPGGHTIDKEIREKKPRDDGYYHIDTKATIKKLRGLRANTHYFLMWHSPSDWEDFTEEFLPAAERAGIDVWAYIVPPSECHADGWCSLPFKTDYIAWAKNIAELSVEYDVLKGWVIDDFVNGSNSEVFTPEYMGQMQEAADAINPDLELGTVAYYKTAIKSSFYEQYAPFIDSVVFPYRAEPNHNTRQAEYLPEQLDTIHALTDEYDVDLDLLLYTGRFGTFDTPKPSYVKDLMATALEYAEQGKIQGLVSYGTPHRKAPAVSSENDAMFGNGRLAFHAFAGAPATDDYQSATQTITVDPKAQRHTLNFWIQNRFYGKESAGKRFAEVLVNDEVVWSTDIYTYRNDKNGRWRKSEGPLEIDKSVFKGKKTAELTFRVRQEVPSSFHTTTSFDSLEVSGLEVENVDFEKYDGWEFEKTHAAFVPGLDIWQEDRPTRVFDEVSAGFKAFG